MSSADSSKEKEKGGKINNLTRTVDVLGVARLPDGPPGVSAESDPEQMRLFKAFLLCGS